MTWVLIETTQTRLVLALYHVTRGVHAAYEADLADQKYHSALFFPVLTDLLDAHGKAPSDVQGLAINCGPGSFTGIRIGLTIARTWAQFFPVQTVGLNTFLLAAAMPEVRGQPVTLLLNAFRNRHYRAALCVDATGEITWLEPPAVCPNETPIPVTTPLCFVEPTLWDRLYGVHPNPKPFERLSPEAMAFYLDHRLADYTVPWTALKPLYLQEPHITVSTKTRPA